MHAPAYMCGDQRTSFKSWFSPFVVGPRDKAQVVRFAQQVLLPTEPSHWLTVFFLSGP